MSLYSEWQGICDQVQEQEPGVARKFWKEYFAAETENYKKILGDYTNTVEGKLSDLAKEFNMDKMPESSALATLLSMISSIRAT